MRALVYAAPSVLEVQDVAEPEPGYGEIVVEVAAAGICGSELEGFANADPFRVPPLVMGHEFAGVRTDTGAPVVVNPLVSDGSCDLCLRGQPNLCRDRAVLGIHRSGGFAERVAVPQQCCYPWPQHAALRRGVLAEPFANAFHAFRLVAGVDPAPMRVGVIGAGMLGLAVALVCLRRGVPAVEVVDLVPARLEVARNSGVHAVGDRLQGEYDVVFDAVGSAVTRRDSVERLRPGGTALWIGLHGPEAGFDGLALIRGEKRVLGTFCYHDQDFRAAIDHVAGLEPAWVAEHPLEEGVEVFTGLLRSPPAAAKTMLVP